MVDVVVSVSQWGGIVEELGGDCATVTTVVASAGIDPHDFEPNVADIAAFSDAQLVVVNGSGYDNWAITAAANVDEPPVIIRAAEVAGLEVPEDEHGGHEAEPSRSIRRARRARRRRPAPLVRAGRRRRGVAPSVSEWLAATSPDAADYFAERRTAWTAELDEYFAAVDEVRAAADGPHLRGHRVGVRPDGRRRRAHRRDAGRLPPRRQQRERARARRPDRVRGGARRRVDRRADLQHPDQRAASRSSCARAAEDADVPVVEVTESPPDPDGSFVEWQLDQLEALSDALGGTP